MFQPELEAKTFDYDKPLDRGPDFFDLEAEEVGTDHESSGEVSEIYEDLPDKENPEEELEEDSTVESD